MIIIWDKIKKNHRYDYLLFFILGLITFSWFKGDHYISGGTFTWHPDFKEYLRTTAFVWEQTVSTGYSLTRIPPLFFPYAVYGRIFQFIFPNSLAYEKTLFYLSFSTSGAATYFLLTTLGLKRIPRLIGSLLYMLNPFASVVVWYLSIGLFFPFYSFLPLAVAFFIRVMEGKMSFVLANVLIFLFPMGISYASPVFFFIFYFILFSYCFPRFLYCLFERDYRELKTSIFLFSKFTFLLFLLNIYWIVPFLSDFQHQFEAASNVSIGLTEDLPTLRLNSLRFSGVFRLLGLWSFDQAYHGEWYYPWHKAFFSPIFTIFSFILGILVLLGIFNPRLRKNRNNFFWPFLLFLGIVSISGLYFPAFSFLDYLYQKFPYILRAFRGGFTKFGFIYILPYIVLFSFGVELLHKKFKKWAILILIPVIFNGFPFFSGSVIHKGGNYLRSYLVKIPESYSQFKDWDETDKTAARYLVLPISKADTFSFKWENGYQGADYLRQFSTKSLLNTNFPQVTEYLAAKINSNEIATVNNLLSLMNIKKIIYRDDYNWRESDKLLTGDKGKIGSFLNNYEKEKEIGIFKIYKVSESYYLPRFYIPKNTYYLLEEGLESIFDTVKIRYTDDLRLGFYLGGTSDLDKLKLAAAVLSQRGQEEILIAGRANEKINDQEVQNVVAPKKFLLKKEDFQARPGSLFYPLSLIIEKKDKNASKNNPENLLEKYLYYADKRIEEIQKFGIKDKRLNNLIDNYQGEAEEVISLLKNLKKSESEKLSILWSRAKGFYWDQQKRVSLLDLDEGTRARFKEILEEVDYELENLKIKRDFSKLNYWFVIPEGGMYEIFISKNGAENYEVLNFNNNSFRFENSVVKKEDEWVSLGEKYFIKGKQKIILSRKLSEENLLDEKLKIQNYSSNSLYRISFSYRSTDFGSFSIHEWKLGELFKKSLLPTGGDFKKIELFFKSSPHANQATFFLSTQKFQNLRIGKIDLPKVIIKSKVIIPSALESQPVPRILFAKVNPTKFKIKVEDAGGPYTFVFLETFHPGWKVYINKAQSSELKAQNEYGETVASYFGGQIKEGMHKNIFLDRDTFETWGKKPLPEDRHLLVNGYANSWKILPDDVDQLANYEMVVEFYPQKIFYVSLIVSTLIFLGLLSWIVVKDIVLMGVIGKHEK